MRAAGFSFGRLQGRLSGCAYALIAESSDFFLSLSFGPRFFSSGLAYVYISECLYFAGCFLALYGLFGGALPVYFFKKFTYLVKNLNKIFGSLVLGAYLCRVLNDKIF